jgi:GTP-binding protein
VLVAANKADAVNLESDAGEFHGFGFADVFAISAEHGNGIGELLDSLEPELQGSSPSLREGGTAEETSALPAKELRLAIVGRPNVGKSSLLNRLLGEERAIVSPVAGTTRDTFSHY